jgi:hypothetical protein
VHEKSVHPFAKFIRVHDELIGTDKSVQTLGKVLNIAIRCRRQVPPYTAHNGARDTRPVAMTTLLNR